MLLLGGLGLIVLLLLLRLFVDAKPAEVKAALIWGGGILGVLLLALLLVSGRASQAIWALALLGPAAWRWWQGRQAARTFARGGQPAPGHASDVETPYLAMALDHDSGRMSGRVKAGRFAGQDLGALDLPGLLELLAELAAVDADGVKLLEAWLDRAHPDWRDPANPEWRDPANPAAPPRRGGPMTRAEALAVLGLPDGATPEEIRGAHRRLMRSAHPDRGGSDWLAARLNEARDTLLQP